MQEALHILLVAFLLLLSFAVMFRGKKGFEWAFDQLWKGAYWVLREAILGARMILAAIFHWFADFIQPADMKGRKKKKKKGKKP